jgi:hypothetical protein
MAYVKDRDESYVMNAADKYNLNLVPYDVLYTDALVVDKNDGGLIRLNSDHKFTNNISSQAVLKRTGNYPVLPSKPRVMQGI